MQNNTYIIQTTILWYWHGQKVTENPPMSR